ncbi:MAG: nuclear transport factor 2 family protein [Actinomycetia bacterium]|nr:nuclear transport factor 2 family protein [Actinomycetes bacterium]
MMPAIHEYEGVRAAVQAYADACALADAEALRAALHPRWTMYGIDELSVETATGADDFVDWVDGQVPPTGYRATITNIDIAGDAAKATLVEEKYYDIDYVIYFTLVRYDGAWSITTKTFSQVPPKER